MVFSHPSATGDQHLIECHGERSYWVVRYPASSDNSGRIFSRVVYFAHSEREAQAYIRQYRYLK